LCLLPLLAVLSPKLTQQQQHFRIFNFFSLLSLRVAMDAMDDDEDFFFEAESNNVTQQQQQQQFSNFLCSFFSLLSL